MLRFYFFELEKLQIQQANDKMSINLFGAMQKICVYLHSKSINEIIKWTPQHYNQHLLLLSK